MNQTITIYLNDKNGKQTPITVYPYDKIGSLDVFKDNKNVCFLFQNKILQPSFSFGFYGIKNDDHILIEPIQESTKPKTSRVRPGHKPVMRRPNEYRHMFTDYNKLSAERRTMWETLRHIHLVPFYQMMSHNMDTYQNNVEFHLENVNLYQSYCENPQKQKEECSDVQFNLLPGTTPGTDALPPPW